MLGVEKNGRTTVASPVLGRLLLTGRAGPWTAYAKVMDAADDRRFGDAVRQVALLEGDVPHLQAFKGLVTMLAALHDSDSGGLLEIDWNTVRRTGRHLLASGRARLGRLRLQMRLVGSSGAGLSDASRARATQQTAGDAHDGLARQASAILAGRVGRLRRIAQLVPVMMRTS